MAAASFLGRQLSRHCRRIVILGCFLVALHYFMSGHSSSSASGTNDALSSKSSNGTCVRPQLDLWTDSLRNVFKPPPPLKCKDVSTNWVHVSNGTFQISDEAVRSHGPISCDYIPIYRGKDDFEIVLGTETRSITNGSAINSDVFRVNCTSSDGQTFTNYYSAISPKTEVLNRSKNLSRLLPDQALKLNIIMFGFDSVSRLTWMRNLPKSYEYIVNKLGAVVMEGYNVVGDGTPQALLPILTGFTEPELPEARRGFAGAKTVDDHPWIWNRLKEVGYVTQWGEESPNIGTFTYRMLGFRDQPVDHYMRTFYLAAEPLYKLNQPHCLGSVPRHSIMLQTMRDFLDVYNNQSKFSFIFHSEYSHGDSNKLQWADDDLVRFLEYVEHRGHLNSSLLVLMSDHGARFQNVRATEQGKYEERMPFLALRVPPWFSYRYPEVVRNIRANADKLTTPFDLHETLVDAVNYTGSQSIDRSRSRRRGISMFSTIPAHRTCADAEIETHWCTCLKWEDVSTGSSLVQRAVGEVLSTINRLTEQRSSQCARLTVGDVTSAARYVAGDDLLRFRKSSDVHGRTADLSDNIKPTVEFYQVTFFALPSNALYEATVKRSVNSADEGKFTVNIHDISRINRYGSQPDCVAKENPHLRPFCYCV